MAVLTGGEAVYETLLASGVDHVFGIVSVHNIAIYDAILRGGKIKTIDVRHEQGAIHAAQGYSRVSGKAGVCMVTSGPGATNLTTGLADAMLDSTPVICIPMRDPSTRVVPPPMKQSSTLSCLNEPAF